ncbi:MAG: hypothetical protein K9J12_07285 [Melioribacteraceae bacterium]|nr:hypothetical protein [Melioribacteraceae bacterium]MCF8412091.1 hypothetical protein [Melioribacteraceae bacterium]MCF8432341.1 hypothetical protein [Melioribacteraceae bacterium]
MDFAAILVYKIIYFFLLISSVGAFIFTCVLLKRKISKQNNVLSTEIFQHSPNQTAYAYAAEYDQQSTSRYYINENGEIEDSADSQLYSEQFEDYHPRLTNMRIVNPGVNNFEVIAFH